jgi:hypothetical protein
VGGGGGIKKGDVIKTEYYVRYDECPNDLWHFPLLTDLKNKGDLIIVDE